MTDIPESNTPPLRWVKVECSGLLPPGVTELPDVDPVAVSEALGFIHVLELSARWNAAHQEKAPASPVTSLLDLPLPPNPSGAATVRGYLKALLADLWHKGSNFSSKRPFGYSGWQYDLYVPMVRAGIITGHLDQDGDVAKADTQVADELILAAIEAL